MADASKIDFCSLRCVFIVCVAVWIVYKQEFDHKIIIIIHMSAHTRRIIIFHSIWWCSHSQYQIHYRLPLVELCERVRWEKTSSDKRHKLTHSVSQVNQCIFIWRFHTDQQPKCSQIRYSTACHTPHWHLMASKERTWENITKCSIPYALTHPMNGLGRRNQKQEIISVTHHAAKERNDEM